MRKTLTALRLFAAWLICAQPLFGQDVYFTNRAETLYERSFSISIPITRLDEGTVITHIGNVRHTFDWSTGESVTVFLVEVQTESGLTGWLAADAVSIRDSVALPERITENLWMHSYYLDVLQSGYMERLFEHEPFWHDGYDPRMVNGWPWYHIASPNTIRFSNVFVRIQELSYNSHWFINGRVEENDGSYFVHATYARKSISFSGHFDNYFSEGEDVKFALQPDGDFLDVFVDGIRIFTLVKFDSEAERQFGNLMNWRDEPFDISRIVWPRRADGTMDIPPPSRHSGFESSHLTTAQLRVRDEPSTDSLIVTTLDADAEIQVLETGSVETIGGTTASWVRVFTAKGFTGWAFSGFIELIAVEPEAPYPVIAEALEEQAAPIAAATPSGQPMPPLSAFVAVAVAAIAVVLLVKRKKK